jgi:hypothetical protein
LYSLWYRSHLIIRHIQVIYYQIHPRKSNYLCNWCLSR